MIDLDYSSYGFETNSIPIDRYYRSIKSDGANNISIKTIKSILDSIDNMNKTISEYGRF